MTDAVRRVLSLAGADPRKLSLVAFGGMGGVHATTQARRWGCAPCWCPGRPPVSRRSDCSPPTTSSTIRVGTSSPWAEVDPEHLARLARELEDSARRELDVAGVPGDRIRLEWSLLLVYPGQTFDTAIAVDDPTDVGGAVERFHRINAEARLIEARAQEPVVRGIRLTAVGEVDPLAQTPLPTATDVQPRGHRRMWVGDAWHESAVYDMADVLPGVTVTGPAAVVSPFTTIIVAPDETARVTADGDVVIDIEA